MFRVSLCHFNIPVYIDIMYKLDVVAGGSRYVRWIFIDKILLGCNIFKYKQCGANEYAFF